MLSKLYETIQKILRQNYQFFIAFFVIYFLLLFPLPYTIEAPGGIIDISNRVKTESKISIQGSYNMAYVSEYKGTIMTSLLSFIMPDWKLNKIEVSSVNENEKATYLRDHLMLEEANQNAIVLAMRKANKKVVVKKQTMYITYLDPDVNWKLKVGDELEKANGISISSKRDLSKVLDTVPVGDDVIMTVKRDKKTLEIPCEVRSIDGKKQLGIIISFQREIETDPKVELDFKSSESGPSGGFMMSLSIYQSLIQKDLTNGLKIVGTGTIDEDGNVGSIGGIQYKLMGAEKAKADLFFVPAGENYQDALKLKKDRNYKMKLVKIKTLDEAIQYLEEKQYEK